MSGLLRNPMAAGVLALVAIILAASTFAIVPETRQGVIVRFEEPKYVINGYRENEQFGSTGAGLIARIPFADRIVWIDKRVLDLELDDQAVLSTDQLRLQVDAFARFRVTDPRRMFLAARSEEGVIRALTPLFSSALRAELGKREFAVLLSPERTQVMDSIQARLQRTATQYGVQIVDVRIKHADLPTGSPLDSALEAMRSARQQQALTIAARGQQAAQIVRADADATAAKVYSDSFGKDPQFYDFYRAMQSYRQTFGVLGAADGGRGTSSFVLGPNSGYLREFRAADR